MRKELILVISFLLLLIFAAACSTSGTDPSAGKKETASENTEKVELTVSAAISVKEAMTAIQSTYKQEHPEVKLTFNYGSSGALQQQISQGAPVDLFFSAAEDKFDRLIDSGDISKEDGVDLVGNELVLIVPKEEKPIIESFQDLAKEEVHKVSIGTPESVPAGKYAKESLEKIDVWNGIESKVVYAKDVRQVLSYVETGNVDAGIVYKTDAFISDKVNIIATADPKTHTPIIYPVGIIKDTNHYKEAKDFYSYLQNEESLKVFKDYGFTIE